MHFLKKYAQRYPAFHYHDYRLMWLGQLVSTIGSQMEMVALNWQMYVLTNSPVALGIIGLVRVIPIVIFSLLGGALADTHNRKTILFATQTMRALFAFVLAFQTITNNISPLTIYILTALSSIGLAIDTPTRQSFIPTLVKKEHLVNAISLNMIMFQTASILGPAIAGFVIAHYGLGLVYLFNAFSFIAVVVALFFIKATGEIEGTKSPVSLQAVKDGIAFARSKTILWSTMLLDFFSTFFSSATALLPIFAKDILAVGPEGLGILYAAPAVGAVIAGFAVAHADELRNQGKVILLAVFFYALGTILFGVSKTFILSFIALCIVGGADTISAIIRHTVRQVVTPDNMRGRIVAINMIFFMGGPQLGEFEAGLVAAWVGAPLSVVSGGIATVIVVGILAIAVPGLRNYDRHHVDRLYV